MRLMKFYACTIVFGFFVSLMKVNAQRVRQLNLMEGILIYDKEEVADDIPIDVIFIPFQINRNENLAKNLSLALSNDSVNYYAYFQNIRHSQPYIHTNLGSMDTLITNKFVVSERLRTALEMAKRSSGKAFGFPSGQYPNIINCEISIIVGAILFDKSIVDYYLKQPDFPKNPIVKKFQLEFNGSTKEVKYYQYSFSNSLGLKLAFLPIILPEN